MIVRNATAVVICCVVFVLAIGNHSGTSQEAPKSAEAVANELARRAICEAYLNEGILAIIQNSSTLVERMTRTLLNFGPFNPTTCEWPESPLEAHLATVATLNARLRLQAAILRLDTASSVDGSWKSAVTFLVQKETKASNDTNSLRGLEIDDEKSSLARRTSTFWNRLDPIVTTAAQIKEFPEFSELSERVPKIRESILKELTLQPELLKPFLDRRPLSEALVTMRKAILSYIIKLNGAIQSLSGEPLANVVIFYDRGMDFAPPIIADFSLPVPSVPDIQMTKSDGSFSLSHHGKVISFYREGYRPVIKTVDASVTTLNIVLEPAQETEWTVPPCKALTEPGKRIGLALKLQVSKGTNTSRSKGKGADYYEAFDIGYGTEYPVGTGSVWINGIVKPNWRGVPPDDWILGATGFTVRGFRAGDWHGFDVRGHAVTGAYWRFLGWPGQTLRYSVPSQELAMSLDKLIDSACH